MPSSKPRYDFRYRGDDYPTVPFIVLTNRLVLEPGEGHEILEPNLLASAEQKPVESAGGEDAYPTLFAKVAAIGHAIGHGHLFENGNKRTAAEVIIQCLYWNDRRRSPNRDVMIATMVLVATGHLGPRGLRIALLHMYGLDLANDSL